MVDAIATDKERRVKPDERTKGVRGLMVGLAAATALTSCAPATPGAPDKDPNDPATEVVADATLASATSALCVPSGDRYNCGLSSSSLGVREGPRVLYSVDRHDLFWPLKSTATVLTDGTGRTIGTVKEPSVRLNYGQRKTIGEVKAVYAFNVRTNIGQASGWIPQSQLMAPTLNDTRSPTTNLPNPGQGFYEARWTVTGGTPSTYQANLSDPTDDWRVSPNHSGDGEKATDYLLRPGNVVHLTYNVPGLDLGGFAVDTVPVGSHFRRAKGVLEREVPLYKPGSSTRVGTLRFIYGVIEEAGSARFGWVAREALTL